MIRLLRMIVSEEAAVGVAAEDDPLAVAVDHVALDQGALSVGVELDPAVGVLVDPVVADDRVGRGLDVDAVVVVGRGQAAAVMDAVALDQGP